MGKEKIKLKNLFLKVVCLGLIAVSFNFLQQILVSCNAYEEQNRFLEPLETIYATSQEIGENRSFWTFDFSSNTFYELQAILCAIGEYCYFYMEDRAVSQLGETEARDRCEAYRDEFDTTIYPSVTDLTGNPTGTLGDIDGDPRTIILLSTNPVNYYGENNEVQGYYSNLCEMVYINYNVYDMAGTIAHEFCHLIWFNYEFDEAHFLLEGLAEYARYYTGYLPSSNLTVQSHYFLIEPEDSLIYCEFRRKDYGGGYLFVSYLAEQFGVQFLRDLVQQQDDGAEGIEAELNDAGYNLSFNELYLNWITALAIDEPSLADGQFGLLNMDVAILEYTSVESLPFETGNISLNYYGSRIQRLTNPLDRLTVEIHQSGSRTIGLSIAFHDADGWHVQQVIGSNTVLENVSGDSVDIAYVITSYLSSTVPSGNIDYGDAPTIEVNITLRKSSLDFDGENQGQLLIIIGISLCAISVAIVIILIRRNSIGAKHS